MATYSNDYTQSTSEIRTYTVDFTDSLPSAVTVTAGTATHTPPSGTASTITTQASSPYVYVTVPALTTIGLHYVDCLATFSNNDKFSVRLAINVVYSSATARAGMSDLVLELRGMCDAGANDFTVAGVPYWSDKQLQTILDNHRVDVVFSNLTAETNYLNGTAQYQRYISGYPNLEQGTVTYIQTAAGSVEGTANYSVDYQRGIVEFTSDQQGTAYYITTRSYELNAAASELWKKKAATGAAKFDFSTDNHSIKASQYFDHCMKMSNFYAAQSDVSSVTIYRGDN